MKLSTNEKLEKFYNFADDLDDSETVEAESKAKSKLKKMSLYGNGARAQIPKTKRDKDGDHISPFKSHPDLLYSAPPSPIKTPLTSSIPPGAHQDLYRIVCNPTNFSRNDPNKIFLTSPSMTEGIVTIPQPAWYVGSNIKPCDTTKHSVNRYGYRGAHNISEYLINPAGSPAQTIRHVTPAFLQENTDITNEYVPRINGAPFGTINNLETPKLWPENTEYTTGFKKKKFPTSPIYIRETTVVDMHNSFNPKTSAKLSQQPKLLDMLVKDDENRELIASRAKMEMDGTFKSLPLVQKERFHKNWDARVKADATNQLSISMNRTYQPYEAHTLADPMDELCYSGKTAFIVSTVPNEELHFRLQMEKNGNSAPYDTRWKVVETIFKQIKSKLKRDRTIKMAITELGQSFRVLAMKIGTITSLRRADFIGLLSTNKDLESLGKKGFSQLFNVFDPRQIDLVRFVEILASLSLYDQPDADIVTKLSTIWKLYEDYGSDFTVMDICFAVLNSFSASDTDKQTISSLFKEQFRPTCYRMSVMDNMNDPIVGAVLSPIGSPQKVGSSSAPSTPAKVFTPKKKDLQTPPAYNISENYLDHLSFLQVLERCPQILSTLDRMLSIRLCSLYSNDPRAPKEVVETPVYEPPPPPRAKAGEFDASKSMFLQKKGLGGVLS